MGDMFGKADRVLVLGAGGWFGQTMLDLMPPSVPVLAIARSARGKFAVWETNEVAAFAPTAVVNFAFLTRERVDIDGEAAFRLVNEELTRRFLWASQLPSVRTVLTTSSGAAVTEPQSPYGELKRAEEKFAMDLVTASRAVVVARVYSVSGAYVRRPHDYAFSDFILQAQEGSVHVLADRPVFRRFVGVDDVLTVTMGLGLRGWSGLIETGGELIELGRLAQRIISIVNPSAKLSRSAQTSDQPSVYASDNVSWSQACADMGHRPAGLDAQIRNTASGLVAADSPVGRQKFGG